MEPGGSMLHSQRFTISRINTYFFNLLSAYDVILSHAITVMQWPVGLNTSCCGSVLTQNL